MAEEIKLYYDFKSPYAYLAKDPAFALAERFDVHVRWIPFVLRLKGKGQRSTYSEYKARYSYMDARRWANRRGGFKIMGPPKIYDSTPALVAGLWAESRGFFRALADTVYPRFFERTLEIDEARQVADVVEELDGSGSDFLAYLAGQGVSDLEACLAEAADDHVFGVPLFYFRGEPFWGHDRLPLLEERLGEAGLALDNRTKGDLEDDRIRNHRYQ